MILRFPKGLKKAVTLSYDDGVQQDRHLIEILDRYGIRATFNLNSGCFAKEGTVYPQGQVHRRMTLAECKAAYDTSVHEVAVHGLMHFSPDMLSKPQLVHEFMTDRENLEREFGGLVRGAAYAFGCYSDDAVRVLEDCGIRYCRTVHSTHSFNLPANWLTLDPTCHHDDEQLFPLVDKFLADNCRFSSRLFYLWGHAYEFEGNNNWERIEEFCKKMSGHDDIWYCTNIEVRDYEDAYRSLIFSADSKRAYNPTVTDVWGEEEGKIYYFPAGKVTEIE